MIVPKHFQLKHPFKYPIDNDIIFESWFFENFSPSDSDSRVYLSVFWTSYFCTHRFGKDLVRLAELQEFVDSLDRSKKYFTIVQYDDGCLVDFKDLDIKVFAMSGPRIDYPLPLICKPHTYIFNMDSTRDTFMSFVGRNTHPLRSPLYELSSAKYYITAAKHSLHDYCHLLRTSVFSLCPRGYGASSFRIMESMQYGSIPVYISDEFIEPHGIDFNEYGVKIAPNEIWDIERILKSISKEEIEYKQRAIKEIYEKYYTYQANRDLILKNL